MISLRLKILATVLAVLSACGHDLFGPDRALPAPEGAEFVQGQVRVSLTVTPAVLTPPGTVVATLTYENLGQGTVALGSSYGCLSFAQVYLGEQPIPFESTQYGCTAAGSSRDLVPGRPLTVEWPLVIGSGGLQVPPGTYRFVAELNTHAANLERTFVVR